MVQKVLTWSSSQINSLCSVQVSCLLISAQNMYSSQDLLQVSKM